jgi:hypothetical protein
MQSRKKLPTDVPWKERERDLDEILTDDFIERFFCASYLLAPKFEQNFDKIHPIIEELADSRTADTIGMIMAGYYTFLDEKITRGSVLNRLKAWTPFLKHNMEEEHDPQMELLDKILYAPMKNITKKEVNEESDLAEGMPSNDGEIIEKMNRFEPLVKELIANYENEAYDEDLERAGIILLKKKGGDPAKLKNGLFLDFSKIEVRIFFSDFVIKATGISRKNQFFGYFEDKEQSGYTITSNTTPFKLNIWRNNKCINVSLEKLLQYKEKKESLIVIQDRIEESLKIHEKQD